MYPKTTNPSFDIGMELLCSLPRYPLSVPVSVICHDFGFTAPFEVVDLIRQLRKRGYQAEIQNGPSGMVAFISPEGWERAKLEGRAYFAQISRESDNSAERS